MENKKRLKTWHIILIVLLVIIVPYALLFGAIFGWAYFESMGSNPSFEINENGKVDIKKLNLDVSNKAETITDVVNQCYSLVIKIENNDTKDHNYLQLQYTFTDDEGYIVGTESGYLEQIKQGKKYKMIVSYCGPSYDKITDYELVNVYTSGIMD